LITSAYRRSFFQQSGIALASARAGNVIGGGDWATDRLIPDILRAFQSGEQVLIRNPRATRPWQHVMEPLSGYLLLAESLYTEGQTNAEGWNFGPRDDGARPVQWIVEQMCKYWGEGATWAQLLGDHQHEASLLKLDISKAWQRLGWAPCWSLETTISRITEWHRGYLAGDDIRAITLAQIDAYQNSSLTLERN
jgi:CDP-glucose 4,6-dehydratase